MTSRPDYAQKMVGWYDPPQLLRTGALVLVSQQFALHADNREIQALQATVAVPHDYSADEAMRRDLWIDFVADSGDGFNSTYAVASELARDSIRIEAGEGRPTEIQRGQILIFGGDLIYPTPTGQGYDDRLIHPYRDAFGTDEARWPDVWAVPGNHDWYDSLSAFRRLFCTEQDFGPWTSRQRRSYFAVKLPHHWWLFGVDLQLLHEIDQQQLWYFQEIIEHMGRDDRIILCSPEPYWLEQAPMAVGSSVFVKSLLRVLLDSMGDRLRLAVAGDLHHYQRLSADDSTKHFITCGTGGAFLHPTHVVNLNPEPGFSLRKSYPDADQSRRLTRSNALFLGRNPLFGIVPAFFYLLVAWSTGINVGEKFGEVQLRDLEPNRDGYLCHHIRGFHHFHRLEIEEVSLDRRLAARSQSRLRRFPDILGSRVSLHHRVRPGPQERNAVSCRCSDDHDCRMVCGLYPDGPLPLDFAECISRTHH